MRTMRLCTRFIIILIILISITTINVLRKNAQFSKEIVQSITQSTTKCTTTVQSTTTTTTTTKKKKKKYTMKRVATASYSEYQQYAQQVGGYDTTQMTCLIKLWNRESGWNPNARNKSSGACGIPQALPCSKIVKQQGSNDWQAQIRWGINYIKNRYSTPCNAWNHFKRRGWY